MKPTRTGSLVGLVMVVFGWLLSSSVVAGEEVRVWATWPSHKVLRNENAPPESGIFSAADSTVTLYAARNEFAAFQIVFSGEFKGANVGKLELKGPGGATLSKVDFYREHYLATPVLSQYSEKEHPSDCVAFDKKCKDAGAPREFPEQLVPLNAPRHGAPFDVAAKKNEVVWVDLFVPEDAVAGEYAGTLDAGGTTLKVKLTVWDFALPSVSHFPHWAYIGPEEISWAFRKGHQQIPEMQDAFDAYFQMAHDHRLSLTEGFCYDENYIKGASRKFYDHYSGKAFKGPFAAGFGMEVVPVELPFFDLVKKDGWLNRAFVYLMDEPGSKEAFAEVVKLGLEAKQKTGGQLRRMVTKNSVPPKPDWPRFDDAVDIYCSGAEPPSNIPALEKKGKVVWTYNAGYAGGPYVDAPGPAMRTHAWCGYVSGSRVWFFWDAGYVVDKQCRWKNERKNINGSPAKYLTDLWNDPLSFDESKKPGKGGKPYPAAWSIRLNGDGMLIYPGLDAGINGPLAGFRLKNLRLAAQDFEYLYLLEKMGKSELALAEAKKLVGDLGASAQSPDGQSGEKKFMYEQDPAKWDEARIRLGKALHEIGDKVLRAKLQPYNQYPNPVGHPDYYGGKRF